ncbi:7763_t:CDS:2 [Paraglomus occultum]|uniref:ferroxidase n=1 Tax=Paraglomus occultum TaxID=144539 RepID=A0A9N8W6I6_9GLOM|nr:7763_t:CDS:2 [Paraglomus occultum]
MSFLSSIHTLARRSRSVIFLPELYQRWSTLRATSRLLGLRNTLPWNMGKVGILSVPVHKYCRCYSSSEKIHYEISELSPNAYHNFAEETMQRLTGYFDELGDTIELDGYDVEYSSGVLTLKLGSYGTYVINKQPPNKQIWLSSPISGPKRYEYDSRHKKWFYHRDNTTLDGLLNSELSTILNRNIKVQT